MCLDTEAALRTIKGTEGYMPDWKTIKAGSKWWDVYSIICIILECDLKDGD